MSHKARWLTNFAVFQLGWFACVLGGAHHIPLWGSAFALTGVGLHLAIVPRARGELYLVVAVAFVGGAWDSVLVALELARYTSGQIASGLTAHWIVALWALFATTLNSSLGWIRRHLVLAAALGGIGGPASYLAGHELGAVAIPNVPLTLAVQALGWSVLVPVFARLALHLDEADDGSNAEQRLSLERGG